MVRGFLDDLGLLMSYEINGDEITQYYSSGVKRTAKFEDELDREHYVSMLDKELEYNKEIREEIEPLSAQLDIAEEDYQNTLKKNRIIAYTTTGTQVVLGIIPTSLFIASFFTTSDVNLATPCLVTSVAFAASALIGGKVYKKLQSNEKHKRFVADNIRDKIDWLEAEYRDTRKRLIKVPKNNS